MNREAIKDYIDSQPNKVVKDIDLANHKISYTGIDQKKVITTFRGDEELVRAYILTKLVNELGYSPDKISIEQTYDAGSEGNKTRTYIDIIVYDDNGDAFLFMELKSPEAFLELDQDKTIENQLFMVAGMHKGRYLKVKYLVYYTIHEQNGIISDKCIVIDNEKFHTFADWENSRDSADTLPVRYGKAQKTPYVKASEKDLETYFTTKLLSRLQSNLHNVLWGGGGTDDNEVFSSLVNLILAKIQDEDEKQDGDIYDFQSLTFEQDGDEVFETNEQLFDRINELYKRALKKKLNLVDEKELNKSYVIDTKKFSLNKLRYTVEQLQGLSFVDGKNSLDGKDILGDFFEGIIRDGFKQTKGQFFTPISIVKFMLWATQADKLAIDRIKKDQEIPYMIDPSTGSGTFLIEYMKFITTNMKYCNRNSNGYNAALGTSRAVKDKVTSDWFFPDHRENKWAQTFIYGSEINFNLGTATKVNMILHGDGSTNIFVKDGLLPFARYEKESAPNALQGTVEDPNYTQQKKTLGVNEQFDIILTNPPFSVELDNDTKKTVVKDFLFGDKKNSENLFIERWYQLLRENGRFAAVLPESVFDTTENKYIRLFLFKYFKIKAVVSLPQITFEPYTSTKTSILFAQKKTKAEIDLWNELWGEAAKEYATLKTRVENIIAVHSGQKKKAALPSIKNLTTDEERTILNRMLKNHLADRDDTLSNDELISKYFDELADLCKYDRDTQDTFGYVNTWWVFGEVSAQLSYDIFMAEADNVGYKRTKRGEKVMPNDLYRTKNNEICIDDGIETTILDLMRKISWE